MSWIYEHNRTNTSRFILGRRGGRPLVCIGINPSTAEPNNLDPTLTKVERIALENNYNSWIMLNVYPQRATHPRDIHTNINSTIHTQNINAIRELLKSVNQIDVWCAWGNNISRRPYLRQCLEDIINVIGNKGNYINKGNLTVKGNPKHPLYIASTAEFSRFDIQNYLRS